MIKSFEIIENINEKFDYVQLLKSVVKGIA